MSGNSITDVERAQLTEFFGAFDTLNDGTIAVKDVGSVLRVAGLAITEEELTPFLADWQAKKRERITFEDFLPVHRAISASHGSTNHGDDQEAFVNLLSNFDYGGSGSISHLDLRQFLAIGKEGLSNNEIEKLFQAFNPSSRETNIGDFVRMVTEDSS